MMFHPSSPDCHIMFLAGEHHLSTRIQFLNDLIASEEYLEIYNRVKQDLKDKGVALYHDEAMYLADLCLGKAKTSREDIYAIHYYMEKLKYIEKLKSIDPDFAAFAEKEIILIQATMEVFMRDEIAKAINEEQLITEAENVADFTDAEELELEKEYRSFSLGMAPEEYMAPEDSDMDDSDEDEDEDEESDEKDKKDKGE